MIVEKRLYKNFLDGEIEYCLRYDFSGRTVRIPLSEEEALVLFGSVEMAIREGE